MGYPPRQYLSGVMYEVTARTLHGRFLLRPSDEVRETVLGVIGRAQAIYPGIALHSFTFMGNHYHKQLTATGDGCEVASYLQYVNANIAKRVGALYGWTERFWRPHTSVAPILDDEAAIDRFTYILKNGVKEGLVRSPRDWPGASAVPGLLGNMEVPTTWIDRDRERRDRSRGAVRPRAEYRYVIRLSPLPVWSHLEPDDLRARHAAMITEIEQMAADAPVGVQAMLALHPHSMPSTPLKKTRPPECHATTRPLHDAFRRAYREFVAAFRRVTQVLTDREAATTHEFPIGCFPRPPWFRRPDLEASPTGGPPPWTWRPSMSPPSVPTRPPHLGEGAAPPP